MIQERVNAGPALAKAKGVQMDRGKRKDGARSEDEKRWGMSKAANNETPRAGHGTQASKTGRSNMHEDSSAAVIVRSLELSLFPATVRQTRLQNIQRRVLAIPDSSNGRRLGW